MMDPSSRRRFLSMALAGLAAAGTASVRAAPATRITVATAGSKVAVLSGAGGNVTLLQGPAGPLLVDGGAAPDSAALLAEVARVSGQRGVPVLFNTHWHAEQTGSNLAVGKAGGRIIAHENTRLWLNTTVDSTWQRRVFQPLPKAALPNDTFYSGGALQHGDQHVEYGHLLQAHTDGDIFVHLREANVLVVGDLLAVDAYPLCDYVTFGWIGGMVDANKALLARCDDQTRIVPGQGPLQTRADLQRQYDMLVVLRDRLYELVRRGYSADELIAARPTQDYDARCGDPLLFIRNAARGIAQHQRQIPGVV